jgi:hypothetical protein
MQNCGAASRGIFDTDCAVLPEAATRKRTVSMRKHTEKTVSEQEAAQAGNITLSH